MTDPKNHQVAIQLEATKQLAQHSRETSPSQHDAEAIPAGATAVELDLLRKLPCRPGPWFVLGCGTGRHVRGLADQGREVYGLDGDERMIQEAQAQDPQNHARYFHQLFEDPWPKPDPAVATLLNHTLTVVHTPAAAAGLFQQAACNLLPGGLLVIDDPAPTLWQQIASGPSAKALMAPAKSNVCFRPEIIVSFGGEAPTWTWTAGFPNQTTATIASGAPVNLRRLLASLVSNSLTPGPMN